MNQTGWTAQRKQALDRVSVALDPHYLTREDVGARTPSEFAPVSDEEVVGVLICQAGGSAERYLPGDDNTVAQGIWVHEMGTNPGGPPGTKFRTGTAYTEMVSQRAVFEGRGSESPGSYTTSTGRTLPTNGDDEGHMVIQNALAKRDDQNRQVKKTYVSIGVILDPDVVSVPDGIVNLTALTVARQALMHPGIDLSRPDTFFRQHEHGAQADFRIDPGPALEARRDEIRERASAIVNKALYAEPEAWERLVEQLGLPDPVERPSEQELEQISARIAVQAVQANADRAAQQRAAGIEPPAGAAGPEPAGR